MGDFERLLTLVGDDGGTLIEIEIPIADAGKSPIVRYYKIASLPAHERDHRHGEEETGAQEWAATAEPIARSRELKRPYAKIGGNNS